MYAAFMFRVSLLKSVFTNPEVLSFGEDIRGPEPVKKKLGIFFSVFIVAKIVSKIVSNNFVAAKKKTTILCSTRSHTDRTIDRLSLELGMLLRRTDGKFGGRAREGKKQRE
jgi:hypothetical protein